MAVLLGLAETPTAAEEIVPPDGEARLVVESFLGCLAQSPGRCDVLAYHWEPECLALDREALDYGAPLVECPGEDPLGEFGWSLPGRRRPGLLPEWPLEVDAVPLPAIPEYTPDQRSAVLAGLEEDRSRLEKELRPDQQEHRRLLRRRFELEGQVELGQAWIPYRCHSGLCGAHVARVDAGGRATWKVLGLVDADRLIREIETLSGLAGSGFAVPDLTTAIRRLEGAREQALRSCAHADERALSNLDLLRVIEAVQYAEWDDYLPLRRCPDDIPGATAVDVPESCRASSELEPSGDWETPRTAWDLDWYPETLCCAYEVVRVQGDDPWIRGFEATAECDADADGVPAVFKATQDRKPWRVTPEHIR